MNLTIPAFRTHRVTVRDGVSLHAAVGGQGPPIVLLHGFPQTHLMWRHVATDLAGGHTVICPDLRGYGESDKPAERDEHTYSKRTMAADVVGLAHELGFDRFALAGHDRGALVAVRAGLDHPETVTHLAALDVLPTLDMWDVLHGADAKVAWHLYLMAQPAGLPERMIAGVADEFFASFLDAWGADETAIPPEHRAEYLRAARAAVPSIVADYRASAGIDVRHDREDRERGNRLAMPTLVIQQDWGAALGYDAPELWSRWASDLVHRTLDAGHFMAEQAPERVAAELRALLEREPSSRAQDLLDEAR
ncbi:alpha/beta hydrolase [Georgenia halophila]|uniref:Alpha/beta hydrolase n=1 Tax=Georgenia halophila TaxID=620889 RepID=A0ABP8LAC6_9MICO